MCLNGPPPGLLCLAPTHLAIVRDCCCPQIASLQSFSPNSWVGRNQARFEGRPLPEKYLMSLYFSVSAFTGLGDSSLYAGSVPEAAFMILYL